MFDERDYERASELTQGEIDAAVERHRRQMREAVGSPDGDCEGCGEPIPAARLAAWPQATRCVDCQADHERQQRTTGA